MDNCTIQSGYIDKVEKRFVRIKISQASTCSACHAKEGCGVFGTKNNYLDIPMNEQSFQPGEAVSVKIKNAQGLKAVWFGYVLPFIILIVVLFVLSPFLNEGIAGLMALFAVGFYYLMIRFLGKKLTRAFSYEIIRI